MKGKLEFSSGALINYHKLRREDPTVILSKEDWLNILKTFNSLFMEYLLQTGERDKLPFGMGAMALSKKKAMRIGRDAQGNEYNILPVDWQKSIKAGKKIFILNAHTDGFRAKWKWFPRDSNIRMSGIWSFKPADAKSLEITRYIRDEDDNYLDKWKEWERLS